MRPARVKPIAALAVACALFPLFFALGVRAEPSFFTQRCAGCHSNDTPTCNGCHEHRGNVQAHADHDSYAPGDPVTVTLSGGQEHGWIRGLLYDHNGLLVAIRTGPTGTGDDGQGNPVSFPVTLQATAPLEIGNYSWQAAYFGGNINGNGHSQLTRPVSIVVTGPTGIALPGDPARSAWGVIKALF